MFYMNTAHIWLILLRNDTSAEKIGLCETVMPIAVFKLTQKEFFFLTPIGNCATMSLQISHAGI